MRRTRKSLSPVQGSAKVHHRPRRLVALAALALLTSMLVAIPTSSLALGLDVFINEIHYDNVSTDSGEAIEVAGPAGTDLSGWSLVLYNGSNGKVYGTTSLSGVIPNQQDGVGTAVFSYLSNGIQNGSPDGIALVDAASDVVQFLCYEGTFEAADGPAVGETCIDIGVSESSSTPVGHSLQLAGSGTTYEDFAWSAPAANTFGAVNIGQSFGGNADAPVLVSCGSWLNTYEGAGAVRGVSAADADGTVISMSISVSPTPSAGAITLESIIYPDTVGGTATGDVTVDTDVPTGVYAVTVNAANGDATPQEGFCSFNVDVDPLLTIGEVQGAVSDTDNGLDHSSPYEDEYVVVQGVVYQKTQEYNSGGGAYYGFFLQNTAAEADGDPDSSDGIFVFSYEYETIEVDDGGYYVPQIGDEFVLTGRVEERYGFTRLNYVTLMDVVRSGVVIDVEVPAFDVDPPATIVDDATFDDLEDADRYWERREGMRGQVPVDSIVLNGRDVFSSTFDSEVWVARADSLIAQRSEAYQRRAFRDAHPLDDISGAVFDNGNPYRILLGGFGIKATMDDTTALLAPARAFDTVTSTPTGGVYYNFGKYSIQPAEQITLLSGVDPSANGAPSSLTPGEEYGVAVFNVENLYDYVDDAFDGCDYPGNSGCVGVYPPFDYVPASDAVYQARLGELASQIINDLNGPDIVMVQEVEDQDVCTVDAGVYTCPAFGDQTNDADGKPDTLQELAVRISDMGGPTYDAALDRDGADDRGIISGYLYRTDRVELLAATADHPVLGDDPQVNYPYSAPLAFNTDVQNPKVLNAVLPAFVGGSTDGDNVFTRAPQVAWFRVWRDSVGTSTFQEVYLVNNHFSSGPDRRVEQRTEQANYNAAIVDALQMASPGAYVAVGGDLNVYPRPDDPFPTPNESDQLAGLYVQGMTNLWDVHVSADPDAAYSYIYQGQAQTLDQLFVVPAWMTESTQFSVAHINADWPAEFSSDGPRGTSDHDPLISAYALLPTLDRLEALLRYFDDAGMISGKNTFKTLLGHLEKAASNDKRYEAQLRAFINQTQGKAPKYIPQDVADVLTGEAELLLSLTT